MEKGRIHAITGEGRI
uniref:Uncharacterized protein n=1 Tax=Vitis vinifera TaxID=29760 RepID=F6HJ07_VITVI